MKESGSGIMVGAVAHGVCIRVEGKGTHQNSQSLREFLVTMIEHGYKEFDLDLGDCSYMDSTFLGMLVGVSLRLKKAGPGRFAIHHVSPRNRELFSTLGIEQFFEMESSAAKTGEASGKGLQSLPQKEVPIQQRAEVMLEAHETLASVDGRNVCRFKDVITFLKEDLARIKARKDPSAPPDASKP